MAGASGGFWKRAINRKHSHDPSSVVHVRDHGAVSLCAVSGQDDEVYQRQGFKNPSGPYGGHPGDLHLSSGLWPGGGREPSIYDF